MPLSPPPFRDRFLDERGYVSRPWQDWLNGFKSALLPVVNLTEANTDFALQDGDEGSGRETALGAQQLATLALLAAGIRRETLPESLNALLVSEVRTQLPAAMQAAIFAEHQPRESWRDAFQAFQSFSERQPVAETYDGGYQAMLAAIHQRRPDTGHVFISDTHANRANYPAAAFPVGSFYRETDRTVLYVSTGTAWTYVAGRMSGTLSPDTKPVDLGANDDGFLFWATDYLHLYRWNGAGTWSFGPGDPGSAFVVIGNSNGSAPNGGLWAACDGTNANVATSAGTIAAITTQNLTGDVFIKGAAATAAQQAATRATWEATARTETEAAHTHQVDPPSTTSGNNSASQEVQAGAGVTVADDPHTHDTDIAAFASGAGSAHSHTLVDANAQLKMFSEANGGLPLRIQVVFYMRR